MGLLLWKRTGGMDYMQSPILNQAQAVQHAFSTRRGGISSGAYATLNMGFKTGDKFGLVMENRRRFLQLWGLDMEQAVAAEAVHGTRIVGVDRKDRGRGQDHDTAVTKADGLMTDQWEIVLTAFAADCLIILMLDPVRRVIAAAHAGWRGVLDGMAGHLVWRISEYYGVDPCNLKVAVGPCICMRCFNVGREVAELFDSRGWRKPGCWEENRSAGIFFIDLVEITRRQFIQAGLREENLDFSPRCTSCSPYFFFSHRRDQGITGRMMGFVVLDRPVEAGNRKAL